MRTYLNTPFAEKDLAKELGARWDKDEKQWYVPDNVDPTPFQRWIPSRKMTLQRPASVPVESMAMPPDFEATDPFSDEDIANLDPLSDLERM